MNSALVRAGGICVVAVGLAAALALAAERSPPAPPSPSAAANIGAFEQLKPGAHRDLVLVNCLPCHSTAVIASAHLSRERWDQTITRMQTQNGLVWPIPPETRSKILDYLAATQPPSDPGLEKAKETPWAAPLYRPNPLW
jgi:hypothetical protein